MLKNIGLLVLSSAVALGLAELVVRGVYPEWAPRTPRLTEFWQYDKDFGWAHVPGVAGRFDSFGFDVQVNINSTGYRGPEIAPKTSLRPRVLVIGDSFVWGFGVEQDEIFTSVMQSQCEGLEVVNLGVSGYSTDQELLVLQDLGVDLEPDIVILVVAANDFIGNTRATEYVYYHKPLYLIGDDGGLHLSNRPVPQSNVMVRLAATVARRSYILTQVGRFLQASVAGRGAHSRLPDSPANRQEQASVFPRNFAEKLTTMLVQRFVATVHGAGAKAVVVFLDRRGRYISKTLIPSNNLATQQLDELLAARGGRELYLPEDIHWNAAGHRVVADALVEQLRTTGMIDSGRCAP